MRKTGAMAAKGHQRAGQMLLAHPVIADGIRIYFDSRSSSLRHCTAEAQSWRQPAFVEIIQLRYGLPCAFSVGHHRGGARKIT